MELNAFFQLICALIIFLRRKGIFTDVFDEISLPEPPSLQFVIEPSLVRLTSWPPNILEFDLLGLILDFWLHNGILNFRLNLSFCQTSNILNNIFRSVFNTERQRLLPWLVLKLMLPYYFLRFFKLNFLVSLALSFRCSLILPFYFVFECI